jgi:hypothetical protein
VLFFLPHAFRVGVARTGAIEFSRRPSTSSSDEVDRPAIGGS